MLAWQIPFSGISSALSCTILISLFPVEPHPRCGSMPFAIAFLHDPAALRGSGLFGAQQKSMCSLRTHASAYQKSLFEKLVDGEASPPPRPTLSRFFQGKISTRGRRARADHEWNSSGQKPYRTPLRFSTVWSMCSLRTHALLPGGNGSRQFSKNASSTRKQS